MTDTIPRIGAEEKSYRMPPHNIEVEQALLGAILVNNDAYYRVSDFLQPVHFLEAIHAEIFKVASDMIRATKTANPVTIKTVTVSADTQCVRRSGHLHRYTHRYSGSRTGWGMCVASATSSGMTPPAPAPSSAGLFVLHAMQPNP